MKGKNERENERVKRKGKTKGKNEKDWMGFHIPKNRKIPKIRSDGLLTFGKRETKIRLTVRESRFVSLGSVGFQRSKKPRFISFGELLKNEKELKFELWGFLSLFPSHLPSPLSFFPAIPLSLTFHLGIEINSFALPESNCFGFLILDNRID
ncbi:unnamed protein product [Rhizophagus irregularis]|nr:unnamed protein product [Rhizophagus irregularis]